MTGGSAIFSVVPSRAVRGPSFQNKRQTASLVPFLEQCFADDDSDAVTDLFHQRQQQFVYVRNCAVLVQNGGEALSHEEMPAVFFLVTSESHASLSLATTSKSSLSSHARWQGTSRWKHGWSSVWKGWDDSSATASPRQNPLQVSVERVTDALHMMQDHFQQTTVISQRRSQKTVSEQAASTMLPARPRRPLLRHVNGKKRRGASASKHCRRPQKPRRCTAAQSRTP